MSKIEIIPAINAKTFTDVEAKIRAVEPYVSWVHVDVADGSFTDVTLWHNPEDLFTLQTPLFIEIHLMIANIDERIQDWLQPIVRRIIFHRETSQNPEVVIDACHRSDIRVGMAITPGSSTDIVLPFLPKIDIVQTLAVVPGRSGQVFQPDTLQKISALHNTCPACPIEVDGGINVDTIGSVVRAGASLLVAGSAIFSAPDIKNAIEKLRSSALNS
ncbi:MAG: hypothetical protein A3J54_00400 [Candidatus Ryanbacteria bacterium RIFCSPHIGHO2_02_FULL_45_13b]|uniref:Ribulose-phosphate 3-epimerase n=1 Tax=Candidatus Ryanbacteria bacterium RIFCSPHIGHO2_02_FULL_45_13b TaxID=1802117 RepID=A0A1G2G4J9_9BACT|nr:MAG: hypothetical protein A3J54_00400 [Candidatus Ryanbacteria bacterium RIFCSPHIGHO2_02_FULL_45_13b]